MKQDRKTRSFHESFELCMDCLADWCVLADNNMSLVLEIWYPTTVQAGFRHHQIHGDKHWKRDCRYKTKAIDQNI
ncbi:predicted protein [Botrytis cinerea T4]|uniref:Uncharacterized protein n=1 Tax=Botryotinia fuckeliana (strain T4) TaxID=999810 RepID=G2XQC1_BOTF4|nr:predicted protein [Botrytis cinerea T4]